MRPILVVAALLLIAVPAFAADPKPGSTTTVTCKANPDQKYSCYVPKAYTPKKEWPILYCFAPDAQGNLFVDQYKAVCERRGWIVVGSLNSKNGPWGPIKAAIDAIWQDTEARFALHPKRRYASGFSGGARVSFGLSEQKPDSIAGVIAIGAGLSNTNRNVPEHLVVWLMCGNDDFNRKELDALKPRLEKAGHTVRYENFPGAHVMPSVALMEKAVEWMDDQALETKTRNFEAAIAAAREGREKDPVGVWLALVAAMKKYPELKGLQKEATKVRKSLERDPKVKPEAAALKKLESARAWIAKNRERIGKSNSVRSQAVKKLEEVKEKHAGTLVAAEVEKDLAALPKPEPK